MKHETELLGERLLLIFPNHSPISVAGAGRDHLTTGKRKADWTRIVIRRCSDCAAEAAAETMLIGKSIPVDSAGLEIGSEHTTSPVGFRGNVCDCVGDHSPEV